MIWQKAQQKRQQCDMNQPLATPDSLAATLGDVLRARRLGCGLTPEQVGVALGLSAQAVLAYEEASLSVSVTRLFEFAAILRTDAPAILAEVSQLAPGRQPNGPSSEEQALCTRFGEEIIVGTRRIRDEGVRHAVLHLLREITDRG